MVEQSEIFCLIRKYDQNERSLIFTPAGSDNLMKEMEEALKSWREKSIEQLTENIENIQVN